jgi:rsbT co-antagonist protein RsbR
MAETITAPQLKSLLDKFEISDDQIAHLKKFEKDFTDAIPDAIDAFYAWLKSQNEYKVFFGDDEKKLSKIVGLQRDYWDLFTQFDFDEKFYASRKHVGSVHAMINLPNEIYFAGMANFQTSLLNVLYSSKFNKEKDAQFLRRTLIKLVQVDTCLVVDEISKIQQEKIKETNEAIMEMSTPVTTIWDGVLLLPLIGLFDSQRAQDVMETVLSKIEVTQSKAVVLDISGVASMDTGVANHLIQITNATKLMGCETIISGIAPSIAQTLVELGINVGEVQTTGTLKDAFNLGLQIIHAKVVAVE